MLQRYKELKCEADELWGKREENNGKWPSKEQLERWLGCVRESSELKRELLIAVGFDV